MKKTYEQPELEVLRFQVEDIITTSTGNEGDNENRLPIIPA